MTTPRDTSLVVPYCTVMEMPKQWCAHCRKLPDPVPVDDFVPEAFEVSKGSWITAKFDGKCASCKEGFIAGDLIRNNGRGQWESNCCAS